MVKTEKIRRKLTKKYFTLAFAVTKTEKEQIEKLAASLGYKTTSSYLHDLMKAQLP